jgi:hypothetical protein
MRITHHAWRVATVIMLLAATAAYAAPPGQTKSPSGRSGSVLTLAEARKFLQGRWALESFEVRPPGKEPIFPKGSGVLNYDDFGNMRVEIRADEASSDLLRAAGINIRDGIISSNGRTVIDLQNKTITYFVEGQRSSLQTGGGPLAFNRPRHWEVAGDVLTLTTKDEAGAPLSITRWKKSK